MGIRIFIEKSMFHAFWKKLKKDIFQFRGIDGSAVCRKTNEKTGNDYQNCTVNIDVVAQAIQSDNSGASALEAAGWPAE